MGPSPMALGGVHTQLVRVLVAARAEESADVVISCGFSVIELSFADGLIHGVAGRDATKVQESRLQLEDLAVLAILGWRRETRDMFVRDWHPDTTSDDVADDIMRTAINAFGCDTVELKVLLREAAPSAARP